MLKPLSSGKWILYSAVLPFVLMAASAKAAETNQPPKSADSLESLSLEQLVNVKVTSVAKQETDLFTSPAAISVVTQDDIRRMGATSIPEALRMVPGMDVGQISANQWAVGARGFNFEFANRLLVLVDGRSIYSPVFGGVFWEIQDLVMEDLDRIEVIRGPGATLWGDNAVNGVINIITKSASQTQGGFITTSFGTDNHSITSLRYGGQLATNLFFRAYLKYETEDGFLNTAGNRMPDGWDSILGGLRMDWEPNPNDRFTLEGSRLKAYIGGSAQLPMLTPPYVSNFAGVNLDNDANVEARWTHDFSPSSQLTLQLYYDRSVFASAGSQSTVDAYDVDLQHHFVLGERQDIVWGGGIRDSRNDTPPTFTASFNPQRSYLAVYNVFAQDDVTIVRDRFHLILGTKIDHTTYGGFQFQPSGRLLWTPSPKQTVWMAVSRAVTTPSIGDETAALNVSAFPTPQGPALVTIDSRPGLKPQQSLAYELGYRVEPAPRWSFDLATYYNIYHDLTGYQTAAPFFAASPVPHLVFEQIPANLAAADTYGAELSAQWKPADYLRLIASYSWLHMRLRPLDAAAGDSPQNQFQIRSYLDLSRNIDLNTALSYVDRLPDQHAPSYFGLDLGLNWRINKSWEVGVFGQNLLSSGNVEFGNYRTPVLTRIPRGVFGKITWKF